MRPATNYKPLTGVDYEMYTQMISRLHMLEFVTTQHFLMGEVDRAKLFNAVEERIQNFFEFYTTNVGDCPPGTCPCETGCVICGGLFDGKAELLIHNKLGQLMDRVGMEAVDAKLSQLLQGS